nr:alpha/beta fold hydrolase [Massilia sp. TS11]
MAAFWLAAPLAQAGPAAQLGKACHLPGTEDTLRCLQVAVPRDYTGAAAGQLQLHITIAPAYREASRPDPLFVLAGGPGQAGSDIVSVINSAFRAVRATRDIILIDQRGTGLSGKLDCPNLPDEDRLSEGAAEAQLMQCVKSTTQSLAPYTTANAARDIEQVRKALGYGPINLWGGSYGTRLAQAYARAFPSAVRSLVLDGVAPPEQVIPAGGHDAQAALDKLFAQCAADKECARAFPNLKSEFSALLERAASGKLQVSLNDPRTAAPLSLNISTRRLIGTVQNVLYAPLDARRLPFLIHSAYQGNWAPFVARSNAAYDFSTEGGMAGLLHFAIVCSEDLPRLSPALLAEDSAGSFYTAEAITRLRPYCAELKLPPPATLASDPIAAPVLMFSGGLDPVTPPRRAEAAGRHMQKVQHLIVENAGHGVSNLGCAPRLIREFLDSPGLIKDPSCLNKIAAQPFQTGSAGPKP